MKHFLVLTFAIVAAFCFNTCYGVNFTHGSIGPYDKLLYHEFVKLPAKPNQMVSKNITYPPLGIRPSSIRLISAVRAFDLSKDKVYGSGFASITRGGPKTTFLGLCLKSFRNLGLNFAVEVWGN
ncbi:uncharacterized protein LOC129949172 [Eupeodes corollae]|uniref:uncharacterized protein LOC129949172 n=1 Tax=Eupeodes corollae TaxID=290404 RepID=UPI0024927176|nr:uncharacterized protein LOC129949172 [Eupeodes corollae]